MPVQQAGLAGRVGPSPSGELLVDPDERIDQPVPFVHRCEALLGMDGQMRDEDYKSHHQSDKTGCQEPIARHGGYFPT